MVKIEINGIQIIILIIMAFLIIGLIVEQKTNQHYNVETKCYDSFENEIKNTTCIEKGVCGIISYSLNLRCSQYFKWK